MSGTAQNITTDYESAPIPATGLPSVVNGAKEKDALTHVISAEQVVDDEGRIPTEEELATLRKVAAGMPWAALAMCFIEFAERASYYGSSGPFNNFIRGPLPAQSPGNTGAVAKGPLGKTQSPGALGKGLQTATALTTLFQFLSYVIPVFGGIIADTKWGRFKTICVGTAVGAIAHVLLVIPAIPSVITGGNALAPFIISIIILAFAAGFIKPSLAPLLCDQSPVKTQTIKRLPSGELVILDPATTVSRYLLIFYWAINIGAFFTLATTYAEHDVGFWLAYLLPGIIYMVMPIVLVMAYSRLYKAPPQGSVVLEAWRVTKQLLKNGGWKRSLKGGDAFWNNAKPTVMAQKGPVDKSKVFWDDQFVDELKQSFKACKVFLFIPIFNLADGGFGSTENAMSAAMRVNGVPNDLISNFNSLTIVIAAPIINFGLYPLLRKYHINFAPMWRMSLGFMLGCITMIIGAILQWRIYETSPCGYYATSNTDPTRDCTAPLSLWAQIPLYALPALGEIFINVTSYEIAYTRAPARMKGLVYSGVLFTTALSSALTEIVNPALKDPYLIWPYVALAVASFLCAIAMPVFFSELNEEIVVLADTDRMEGKTQPNAIQAEHGEVASTLGSHDDSIQEKGKGNIF